MVFERQIANHDVKNILQLAEERRFDFDYMSFFEELTNRAGGHSIYSDVECPTKRASLWADMKKGRFLHVPAFFETVDKLLQCVVFKIPFDSWSANFRRASVTCPTSFRRSSVTCPISFR